MGAHGQLLRRPAGAWGAGFWFNLGWGRTASCCAAQSAPGAPAFGSTLDGDARPVAAPPSRRLGRRLLVQPWMGAHGQLLRRPAGAWGAGFLVQPWMGAHGQLLRRPAGAWGAGFWFRLVWSLR
ncbi:MAG: hypothetical protein HZY76_13735 [Anaerolineae bacterium]|nr:MAG: hypothetical protein HZY76_13735 [Anaerolineae bacterium]